MTDADDRYDLGLLFTDGMPELDDQAGYRGAVAARAAGISYRQLDYWARTELVEPTVRGAAGSGTQRLYGFRDILVLKLVKRLLDTGISLQQIRTAVKFAGLAGDGTDVEALIERQLGNADKALGNNTKERGARRVVTNYDLSLVNTESRFEVPKIVEALHRKGYGTLCFYGPPGTGKTALAEHIAKALDKPLMIRQASDLVSKYVGETEQNMAKMFAEAQAEQSVLLLDEADSFLRSRRMAERSYEVSEVNEMLQGMERFTGVFICTTNLFDDLDEAALRRFTFKIRFHPLRREQREQMFVAEALAGDAAALTPEQQQRLAAMDQLVPGDFAAVQRQVDILGLAFDPDGFLAQLESEHRVKPEVRQRRGIGFL